MAHLIRPQRGARERSGVCGGWANAPNQNAHSKRIDQNASGELSPAGKALAAQLTQATLVDFTEACPHLL